MGNKPSSTSETSAPEANVPLVPAADELEIPESIPQKNLMEQLQKSMSQEEAQFLVSSWGAFGTNEAITLHQFKSQAERFRRSANLIVDCDYFMERFYVIMDQNGDGQVDRAEVLKTLLRLVKGTNEDFYRTSFSLYDADKRDEVSLFELKNVVKSMWESGLRELLMLQQDELFDLEEQVTELLLAAESTYLQITET